MPEIARGVPPPILACTLPAQNHSLEGSILLLEFTQDRRMICELDAPEKSGCWLLVIGLEISIQHLIQIYRHLQAQ